MEKNRLHDGQDADPVQSQSVIPVDLNIMSLVKTAVKPISAEFEYLFATGLQLEERHLKARKSLSTDQKCHKSSARLRHKIAVRNTPRRLHKYEKYERHAALDHELGKAYDMLVNDQCGTSGFRTDPAESWVKLDSNAYRNKSNEIYYRRQTTQEFSIYIPKALVTLEYMDDEKVKEITGKREKTSVVPTLENSTFRHIYEKAVKNMEQELPLLSPPPPAAVQPLPISSFVEETPIERALRLAKAKYRKNGVDGRLQGKIKKLDKVSTDKCNGATQKFVETTPSVVKTVPIRFSPPSFTPARPIPSIPPVRQLKFTSCVSTLSVALQSHQMNSLSESESDEDDNINRNPPAPQQHIHNGGGDIIDNNDPPKIPKESCWKPDVNERDKDIDKVALEEPKLQPPNSCELRSNGKKDGIGITQQTEDDDADILNIDIDEDMDWLS